MDKKKIAPLLKVMRIGESLVYPIDRKASLETTKQRVTEQLRNKGVKFIIRTVGLKVTITRIN